MLGAVLVGVIAGPLIAVGYNYFTLWWVKRDAHPMVLITGPSYLSVLVVPPHEFSCTRVIHPERPCEFGAREGAVYEPVSPPARTTRTLIIT